MLSNRLRSLQRCIMYRVVQADRSFAICLQRRELWTRKPYMCKKACVRQSCAALQFRRSFWNARTFGTIGLSVSFSVFSKDALDQHQHQRWYHGMQPEDRFGWVFGGPKLKLALTFSFQAVACKKVWDQQCAHVHVHV